MKKVLFALSLSAFALAFTAPVISTDAAAYHETKCKKGFYYDEDEERCIRESRGSHG